MNNLKVLSESLTKINVKPKKKEKKQESNSLD